jgi:hypothetical protein
MNRLGDAVPNHEEFLGDIPALVRSDLTGDARERLRAHLKECAECRELVSSSRIIARGLRQAPDEALGRHPSPLTIRSCALGENTPDYRDLAEHISSCPTCSLEIVTWKGLTSRRAETSAASTPGDQRITRAGSWRLAAALTLGLLIGLAISPMIPHPDRSVPKHEPQSSSDPSHHTNLPGLLPLWVLTGPARGESTVPTFTIAKGELYVLIAARLAIPAGAAETDRYRFEIRHSAGSGVWSSDARVSDILSRTGSGGIAIFLVPAADLPPGPYEFRTIRQEPGETAPPLQVPFRVLP